MNLPRWLEIALMIPGALFYVSLVVFAVLAGVGYAIRDNEPFNNQKHR
jgi:hypothetical protein